MSASVLLPAAFVAGSVALVTVVKTPTKRTFAKAEAAEQAKLDTTARHDAEIRTGIDKANVVSDPYACAQACALVLHAHLVRHDAGETAITWAATLYAQIGRSTYTQNEQLNLRYDQNTPGLTLAACLLRVLSRARDLAYLQGRPWDGTSITAAIGFIRPEITNVIAGSDRLLAAVDIDEAEFWNQRRPMLIAASKTNAGALR